VSAQAAEPQAFAVEGDGPRLAGESTGKGPAVVLLHGLTASRRYVVHGSRALARNDLRIIAYDARGHGESDPPPPGDGYAYPGLVADLGRLLDRQAGEGRVVLAGHSMGAHTLAAFVLADPERVAGIVAIGPAYAGVLPDEDDLAAWDRLADGLESGGVEGFVEAYDRNLDPQWRDVLLRVTRDRLSAHRHPEAVAQALREVPRSQPFEDMSELEFVELPALVVASHDEADPGHPRAVAESWAQRLPQSRLISEEPGQSPLAWQGGRLSRAIADFCAEPEVAERLG
jgi:pimeloyl-ACP methyl ester carboxylesterase